MVLPLYPTKPKEPSVVEQALSAPRLVLSLFGLLPIFKSIKVNCYRRTVAVLCSTLGWLVVAGGWVSFGIQFSQSVIHLAIPEQRKYNPIFRALMDVPYFLINLRGVLIMTLFIFEKDRLQTLFIKTDIVVRNIFGHHIRLPIMIRTWKRFVWKWAVYVIVCFVLFELAGWWNYLDRHKFTWSSMHAYDPLRIDVSVWQFLIIWITFCNLPFFIAQQIFIVLMLFSIILRDCAKFINQAIAAETRNAATENLGSFRNSSGAEMQVTLIRHGLERLIPIYADIAELADVLSRTFGKIFCVAYSLDVLTMLGYVAMVISSSGITSSRAQTSQTSVNMAGVFVFGGYASLLLLPGILFHEEGKKISHNLSLFTVKAMNILHAPHVGNELHKVLGTFQVVCKEQLLLFHACDLFHVTKPFFVATFTLVVSFACITHEIFSRSEESRIVQKHLNVTLEDVEIDDHDHEPW